MPAVKPNYVAIPAVAAGVATFGSVLTRSGMDWYRTQVDCPDWTPSGRTIGAVWTMLFAMGAASALMVWNRMPRDRRFREVIGLFAANAVLNNTWSWLFFRRHRMGLATVESGALGLVTLLLVVRLWPWNRVSSALLMPYVGWVAFATYLTHNIWRMNEERSAVL